MLVLEKKKTARDLFTTFFKTLIKANCIKRKYCFVSRAKA